MNDLERSLAYTATPDELEFVKNLEHSKLPKFAVVVPSFNQARYLAATLDSIIEQNYPKTEIFVADGGSTDGSLEILADYASRFPERLRFDSKPDGGHFQGVNKGIANTDGDVIAWINSDDLYLPETFWKVATFFCFNRVAMVVYGRNNYVDNSLSHVLEYPSDWSPLLKEQKRRMMHSCLPPQPSLFFRRDAVTLCGALNHRILDYELWLRWQENIPFFFYDDILSLSRLQDEAITVNADESLLLGICDVVHQYYRIVPYSWALRYVYNRTYGAAWARGESPPITRAIRFAAWRVWLTMNATRSPRMLKSAIRALHEWLRESRRAAA